MFYYLVTEDRTEYINDIGSRSSRGSGRAAMLFDSFDAADKCPFRTNEFFVYPYPSPEV